MLLWRRTATTTDRVMCDRSIGNVAKQVASETEFARRGSGSLQCHFFRYPKANTAPDKA